ncbi:MAG TPA: hypothetical protein PLY35_08960 [Thermotogota bacterium]|nr:hypothetical protein [Thermotogota bacterium]
MLSAEQISDNYNKLIKFINVNFKDDRLQKLLKIYDEDFSERLLMAPASAKVYFHSAFPGGYVHHVLNVIENSILVSKLWEERGEINNFTTEELLFTALNHDLGKLGTIDEAYYLETTNKWKIEHGEMYEFNVNINPYMEVADRSIYTLQSYGIKLTPYEFLSIKLHDGLYAEANKDYYVTYSEYKQLKTNLPYIIHQADLMAARIEATQYKNYKQNIKNKSKIPDRYANLISEVFNGVK